MAITIDGTNGLTTDNAALKLDGTTLTVDDTNNRVGIGTASPSYQLQLSSADPRVALTHTTHGSWFTSVGYSGANDYSIVQAGVDERMRIDSAGRVTMPYQPAFFAGIAARTDATISINSLVPFNTVSGTGAFNTGSHFNTSTYLFTAPIAGKYLFSYGFYTTDSGGSTGTMQPSIFINSAFQEFTSGDVYGNATGIPASAGGTLSLASTIIVNLSANDTVGVAARSSLRIYQGHCYFSGMLIG